MNLCLENLPFPWLIFNENREIVNSSFNYTEAEPCFKTLLKRKLPCLACPLITNKPVVHIIYWFKKQFLMHCLPSFWKSQKAVFAFLEEVTETNKIKHLKGALELAFLHLPFYLRLVNPQKREIVYENSKLQADFGNHIGKKCFSFWQQGPCINCVGMEAIIQKSPIIKTEKSGNRSWKIKAIPIMKEDGHFEVMEIIQDITFCEKLNQEVKEQNILLLEKLEEQAKKLAERKQVAALGEMAASLAHELKNPLGAITTAIKLLQKPDRKPEKQTFILNTVSLEVKRLNQMLNHFLAYARFKPPNRQEVSLPQIIDEVYQMIKNAPEFKPNIHFKFYIPSNLPKLRLDPEQWKQVFWNLYLNSLEFTQEGKISTKIWTDKKHVFIEIMDTGSGIAPQDLPKIFKPFFSKRSQGSGLGLAVVKRIVESHQGQISVLSQSYQGTVFTIKIPIQRQ